MLFGGYPIWRPTEIKVFNRVPTKIKVTCEPTESLKFSREPTEMTYGSTEKPEKIPKTNWNYLLTNWKTWNYRGQLKSRWPASQLKAWNFLDS
jgi:hypothetical protein